MGKGPRFILIIGDSLSAKRGDGIPWDRRWPQIFSEKCGAEFVVSNKSRRAATSKTLRNQELDGVDLAIIQLGIVDCVPRYFTKLESSLIARIPRRLRSKVINYFKLRRSQDRIRAYVSLDEYRRNFEFFLDRVGFAVIVKILEPGKKFARINSGAVESVSEYNSVIDSVAKKYDGVKVVSVPLELIDALTLDDGYHLNEEGHVYVAQLLVGALDFNSL